MKQAKAKVWQDADGKLVKDGDPSAVQLVAGEGQLVSDDYVKGFGNASSFFSDINKPHPEPADVVPKIEQFKPGQSNAPEVKGAPKEKVGPVKTLGGEKPSGKVGDHEAAIGKIPSKPDAKTQPVKPVKTPKSKAKAKSKK
jgi:hypothetical protein